MATINGYTKEKLDAIVQSATKSLAIVDGHLIVTREDDSTFDAGQVQGEQGIPGVDGAPGATGPAGTAPVNPPGVIMQFGGAAAPAGYLLCDGTAISRTTYADLFAAIGVAYGAGNGTTTFNLPNLKGRVAVGLDGAQTEFDVLGETGGLKVVTLGPNEIPSHAHPFYGTTQASGSTQLSFYATLNDSMNAVAVVPGGTSVPSNLVGGVGGQGGGGSHQNMPPYVVLNHIIKT